VLKLSVSEAIELGFITIRDQTKRIVEVKRWLRAKLTFKGFQGRGGLGNLGRGKSGRSGEDGGEDDLSKVKDSIKNVASKKNVESLQSKLKKSAKKKSLKFIKKDIS